MLVFGIETSCDDCAMAVVRAGRDVLSAQAIDQNFLHARYGGVVPEVAARQHVQDIGALAARVCLQAGVKETEIDAIAVTSHPGLIGSLLIGASFAKGMAISLRKPLIPVNHVDAHLFGALLGLPASVLPDVFPNLALVVSGGHTNLYHMKHLLDFAVLDYTVDDACGEAFDKIAKMLSLPFPGGVHIEKLARQGKAGSYSLPKAMRGKDNFSYSGIKTWVANIIRNGVAQHQRADLCFAFQEEAFAQLLDRIEMRLLPSTKALIVAGGVSANLRFRQLLQEHFSPLRLLLPALQYCTDNAAMIASLGYYKLLHEDSSEFAHTEWRVSSRYSN